MISRGIVNGFRSHTGSQPTAMTVTINDFLTPNEARILLIHYAEQRHRIFEAPSNRQETLEREFPTNEAISDIELFLGIKYEGRKITVSQHPILTSGLGKQYKKQWELMKESTQLLGRLYTSRSKISGIDNEHREEFFRQFHETLTKLFGDHGSTEGIQQRLLKLSSDSGIGEDGFRQNVANGSNLLALSIWLAQENTNQKLPMPNIAQRTLFYE